MTGALAGSILWKHQIHFLHAGLNAGLGALDGTSCKVRCNVVSSLVLDLGNRTILIPPLKESRGAYLYSFKLPLPVLCAIKSLTCARCRTALSECSYAVHFLNCEMSRAYSSYQLRVVSGHNAMTTERCTSH